MHRFARNFTLNPRSWPSSLNAPLSDHKQRACLTAEHPTCVCMCLVCVWCCCFELWTLSHSLASQTRAQLPQSLMMPHQKKKEKRSSESRAWSWLDWERRELPGHSHHQAGQPWPHRTGGLASGTAYGADLLGAGQAAMLSTARWAYVPALLRLSLVCSDSCGGLLCPSLSLICPPLSASSPADSWGLTKELSLCRGCPIPLPCPWSTGSLSLHTSGHQLLPQT